MGRPRAGLSALEYSAQLMAQGGVCAICRRPPRKRKLAVDHDHRTGAIRGLLCWRCNYGLIWYRDLPESLRAAADYLERIIR